MKLASRAIGAGLCFNNESKRILDNVLGDTEWVHLAKVLTMSIARWSIYQKYAPNHISQTSSLVYDAI